MQDSILTLRDVAFGYNGRLVLSNIDLEFDAGEMVGIIGPNGAGKTTLLRLLMGLIQPQRGRISLGGKPLHEFSRRGLAQTMSLVPQDTQIGYAFTVEEIVAMGRNPYLGRFQPPSPRDMTIIHDAMGQTRVTELARRSITTLSGGERQRVLIARTVAQDTPVMLLDEITANLDLCHQLEVMELASEQSARGRLVLATIHDLAMASRYCDRLVLLADGRVRADGAPENVLTDSNLKTYFSLSAAVAPNAHLRKGLSITPIAPLANTSNKH